MPVVLEVLELVWGWGEAVKVRFSIVASGCMVVDSFTF